MAQSDRTGAANLHGLARVQRERRWLTIMDAVLALSIVLWIASLTLGWIPDDVAWAPPLLVCAVGVHRALVTLERNRRDRSKHDLRRDVERALSRAAG